MPTTRAFLLMILLVLAGGEMSVTHSADELTPGKWKVLHLRSRRIVPNVQPLREGSGLSNVEVLDLKGPHPGHPFLFGNFAINGKMGIAEGNIQRVEGKNAAVSLGEHDEFDLEGVIDGGGTGGLFLMFGWKDGRGNLVYNVTMQRSGSPWHQCEFRRGMVVPESDTEINRYEWEGPKPVVIRVADGRLTLRIDTTTIATERELENYAAGEIMLGSYDTKLDPRPLQIHSLRIRPLMRAP